jgi:hypothetical protein
VEDVGTLATGLLVTQICARFAPLFLACQFRAMSGWLQAVLSLKNQKEEAGSWSEEKLENALGQISCSNSHEVENRPWRKED